MQAQERLVHPWLFCLVLLDRLLIVMLRQIGVRCWRYREQCPSCL